MKDIELRLYRSFLTLCEEKNFARAAERLRLSPPALTHQIQKLEKQLEARLLSRKTKRTVQLTEAGARLFDVARDVLHHAAKSQLAVRQAARGEIGRLNLGYLVNVSWCGLLPTLLSEFHKKQPGIHVDMRAMVSASIVDGIAQQRLDVGLMTQPLKYPAGLDGFVVFEQPCVLALHHQHPLAKANRPIEPALLADEPFIVATIESEFGFRRLTDGISELGRFVPKVSRRAPEMSSILNCVSAGFGIAVVPQSMAAVRIPNLVFRDFVGSETKPFPTVFVHRQNEGSASARAFIDFVRGYRLRK